MTRRRNPDKEQRDWPIVPIPFSLLRDFYNDFARRDWDVPDIGVLPPFSLDNKNLILSALGHPYATAGGEEMYPTIPAKAAALFRGLVKNHGLTDGNKRLAVTAMTAFLLTNGWFPTYSNRQLYRYALRVASKEGNFSVVLIERWIRRHAELMPSKELASVRKQNQEIHNVAPASVIEMSLVPDLLPVDWRDQARAQGIDVPESRSAS